MVLFVLLAAISDMIQGCTVTPPAGGSHKPCPALKRGGALFSVSCRPTWLRW